MLGNLGKDNTNNNNNLDRTNPNNTYTSGAATINDPNYSSSTRPPLHGSSGVGNILDSDKDRSGHHHHRQDIDRNLGNTQYGSTTTGTQPYTSGSTGLTGNQPYSSSSTGTGLTGTQPYSSSSTGTGLGTSSYSTGTGLDSRDPNYTGTHHNRTGTLVNEPQPRFHGDTTGTYSGTQHGYGTTSESGAPGGVKTMHTVESVTRDAQAQIDAQAEEAIRKSRELNAQDHARLQASIRSATSGLEEQAGQLKAQIDQERLIAERHIKETQQQKLNMTAQQQQMEEQKILEAAAKRKLELEQKSMKLQQEIDMIVRQKTQEMMAEKPGNLCFTHQHQDTTVGAQLAGDIGHILDLKNSGRVTETTMQGDVQYQPVQVQQVQSMPAQSAVQAQEHTVQGPETHEKKGGFFHALKTAFTGGHHEHQRDQYDQTGTNLTGTQGTNLTGTHGTTTGTQGTTTTGLKQQPVVGNRNYDQQSTWASEADKHMPQNTQ